MSNARLPIFEKFIGDLRAVWAAHGDNQRRMDKAKPLLEEFVKNERLRAHSATAISTHNGTFRTSSTMPAT